VVGEDVRGLQLGEGQRAALLELIHWWQNRRAFDRDTDPLETMFGGVDQVAAVQTVGSPLVFAALLKPLVGNEGASFMVQAFGVPTDYATTLEAYTLLGLCHFRRLPGGSYISHYATIGRAPADATPEIRSGVTGSSPNYVPLIGVTGISGRTIDWKLEMYRLEMQ
jgi:hypothetical protein